MIDVIGDSSSSSLDLVFEAFVRSFSAAQVRKSTYGSPLGSDVSAVVLVNPSQDTHGKALTALKDFRGRILLFGGLSPAWLEVCDLRKSSESLPATFFEGPSAPAFGSAQSRANIRYSDHPLVAGLPLKERPCCRFDFTNEWNNLGFGRILSEGPWGLSGSYRSNSTEKELAHVEASAYVTLQENAEQSILWWNREVGPIDSYEWSVIEYFLNEYRADLPGRLPLFTEIPWGMKSAVTLRLDCDEDIVSSKPLFELYEREGVPLSLAIHTSVMKESDIPFLRQILASGGSILSHSHTHPENWGRDLAGAHLEAETSKRLLEKALARSIRTAVSPFHKNKDFSFHALRQTGYEAVVSGIISNDPEYLLARAGFAPFAPGILTHSQQCMLHGDCVLMGSADPMKVYKQAYQIAAATETLFGYLDHPFSERYQYGWKTEEQRVAMHSDFLRFMKAQGASFLSEEQALGFLIHKTGSSIWLDERGSPSIRLGRRALGEESLQLTVKWNGQIFSAAERMI